MSELAPKLKRIRVDPRKLYLDPNNPRFITHEQDRVAEKQFLDSDVIKKTLDKMRSRQDDYDIAGLTQSIRNNHWQPVDFIFVRKFDGQDGRYVVLEGNRRVVAVQGLLEDTSISSELRNQIQEIEVMEVIDTIDKRRPAKSKRDLDRKISYLLGVRHHGSLKTWSPFAQAADIYKRYLAEANQDHDAFQWSDHAAGRVAERLSMKRKDVKDRIKVFRAMKQIGETKQVKDSEQGEGDDKGGMKDSYYSVCAEVILTRSPALGQYIRTDPGTFVLDEESLGRIISLSHFDKLKRKGSPIQNPQQWRSLAEILRDDDQEQRTINLHRVEVKKETPENVWAETEAGRQRIEWGNWLRDVTRLLQGLTLAQLEINTESTTAMARLTTLLLQLDNG